MLAMYEFKASIGKGTFGNVYLVHSKSSGQAYVLKKVNLTDMSDTEKNQALREASVLGRCKHENIIRYKEAIVNPVENTLSIVMEYAEHGDMYTAIRKRKGVYFPEDDVLSWFVQITLALQYIHNHNILHRDLKTQNIFLTGNKRIKVGDFGIARILNDQEMATTAVGTPYYISPEICLRIPYNYKSDIWALGCVLYEMSALMHPFQGQNFTQLVDSIRKAQYKNLPRHCSALTQDLVRVMLNPDPEQRPSSNEILAVPKLQPHLYKYLDTFSTAESFGVIDVIAVASVKKNNSRRRSSDDILAKAKDFESLKRRAASVCERPNNSKKMVIVNTSKDNLPRNSTNFQSNKISHNQETKCSKTNDRITGKSTQPMKRTYNLRRKAIDNNTFKELNDKQRQQSMTSEMDCGYQSDLATAQIDSNPSFGKMTKKSSLTLADYGKRICMSEELASNASISTTGINDNDDDVFAKLARKPSQQIRCPHSLQCQCCIFDTLWKNRIKSTGGIDDTEKSRLRRILQEVLGKQKFTDIYGILSEKWNSQYCDQNASIQFIMQHLNFEQKQYVPLLLQLLQLDLIKNLPY